MTASGPVSPNAYDLSMWTREVTAGRGAIGGVPPASFNYWDMHNPLKGKHYVISEVRRMLQPPEGKLTPPRAAAYNIHAIGVFCRSTQIALLGDPTMIRPFVAGHLGISYEVFGYYIAAMELLRDYPGLILAPSALRFLEMNPFGDGRPRLAKIRELVEHLPIFGDESVRTIVFPNSPGAQWRPAPSLAPSLAPSPAKKRRTGELASPPRVRPVLAAIPEETRTEGLQALYESWP